MRSSKTMKTKSKAMQSFPDFGSGSCFEEQRHEAKGKKKQNPINDLDLENWKSLRPAGSSAALLIRRPDPSRPMVLCNS
ncbi:MAG: hypothetical protein SNJ62_09920, partial [Chloracidobacterium sp.]